MASNAKRRRQQAVSYKEPSTDEDFSELSGQEGPARKRRQTPQRKSSRHVPRTEPHLTSPEPVTLAARGASSARANSRRLRGNKRISYQESDTDSEDPDADFEASETSPPPKKARTESTRISPAKKASGSTPRTRYKIKPFGGRPNSGSGTQEKIAEPRIIVSDGNIPAWSTLPYHVLLQIFVYASHPLHDDNFTPTASIGWLARTARLCRTFTKPALTALYRNPPLFAVRQNRKQLVDRLTASPDDAREDYQVMVKRLELDATRMSKLTDPQHSAADLVTLLKSLKTLRDIDIFDPFDRPPYRERLRRTRRWHYPDEVFDVIKYSDLRLKSWRWNESYCARGITWMEEVHLTDAFQSIREVSLTKYHINTSKKLEEDVPTNEALLGQALAVLPNLHSITFESCSVVNANLLPLLPQTLKSLSLINCRELNADALRPFLAGHGSRLEELVLNHNQCLDLSFLPDLKQSCPRLEVFRMDLHYYNTLTTSSDNEPLYDELLSEGELPSWPSTLRVIELEFLRNWTSVAAVAFFESLIDNAGELPWLRELIVTAIVDIDWRRRAEFRRRWTARFQKVFARPFVAPEPSLQSLRAYREWKQGQVAVDVEMDEPTKQSSSNQVDVDHSRAPTSASDSDSDAPLMPKRQRGNNEKWGTRRLRMRAKLSNYDEESDTEEKTSTNNTNEEEDDSDKVNHIQGMCNVVVFKIDNSRPQEQIFAEDDFLDEEASGDEDWDGNDVVEETYAW